MKTTSCLAERRTKPLAIDELLTPNGAKVLARLVRDHGLTSESIISFMLEENLAELEQDIATRGRSSGGEKEHYFVSDVRRGAIDWLDYCPPPHVIGSKSFQVMVEELRSRSVSLFWE
jgi:hypothetical protein